MQTAILSSDFALTSALKSFIKNQVDKTMRGSADHIEKLTVRLKDINGPKGGDDKQCCIEITIPDHAPIVVKKRSTDAYASIHAAFARASRTALRRLRKKRSSRHQLNSPQLIKDDLNKVSDFNGDADQLNYDGEATLERN